MMAGDDAFADLPDHLLLHILNLVSDVRSLLRCRCSSRRLAALVPHTTHLVLHADAFLSHPDDDDFLRRLLSFLLHTLTSFLPSALPPPPPHLPTRHPLHPSDLLRAFRSIHTLSLRLPSSPDLRLRHNCALLRWRASFGSHLRTCVVLAARSLDAAEEDEPDDAMKERVVWTIGALIAASARHHMVRGVAREGMERVMITDDDGEGVVVVEGDAVEEWRKRWVEETAGGGGEGRTVVPAMEMKMRNARRVVLYGGEVRMSGAMLVVARAVGWRDSGDADTVSEAFRSERKLLCAAQELLKEKSCLLEMNSF